jgi:hypothetical protein
MDSRLNWTVITDKIIAEVGTQRYPDAKRFTSEANDYFTRLNMLQSQGEDFVHNGIVSLHRSLFYISHRVLENNTVCEPHVWGIYIYIHIYIPGTR